MQLLFEQSVNAVKDDLFVLLLTFFRGVTIISVATEVDLDFRLGARRPYTHEIVPVQLVKKDVAFREIKCLFLSVAKLTTSPTLKSESV